MVVWEWGDGTADGGRRQMGVEDGLLPEQEESGVDRVGRHGRRFSPRLPVLLCRLLASLISYTDGLLLF